tara:strand:+ start:370 stop:582 length:213 start_codon:yes stop_codon:yes gene_type:complete
MKARNRFKIGGKTKPITRDDFERKDAKPRKKEPTPKKIIKINYKDYMDKNGVLDESAYSKALEKANSSLD